MNKILLIAQREFLTTVANKGFIFGLFLMPVLIGVAVLIGPRLVGTMRSPQVVGRVAVVDPTGQVLPVLRSTLSPAAIQERRQAEAMRALGAVSGGERIPSSPVATAFAPAPDLAIVERPSSADLESEKKALSAADQAARVMALVVVAADAVEPPAAGAEFGTYSIYASRDLNADTERILYESLREAIVTARLTASQLDQKRIDTMTRVRRPVSVTVTQAGEQRSRRQFMQMLPFLVGVMLFAAVIMGGQQLMTSTVEEKSSRVVEVLLAAVSPFQLMFGKLLGQAAVGLLGIAIYLALGLLALYSFAMSGIIDPLLIVYFLVFFLITYLVFGALMMSIGAAVNTMQEAGSLMGPVMLMLLFPYMLSPMIGRAPNSPLSVAMSFIPPINSFAMMTRMSSESPPPSWQIWLTLLIGIGTVFAAIWFAAKIFKVGLLMHGKPPNVATLIRWARQA